jgi:hypothetical protein
MVKLADIRKTKLKFLDNEKTIVDVKDCMDELQRKKLKNNPKELDNKNYYLKQQGEMKLR